MPFVWASGGGRRHGIDTWRTTRASKTCSCSPTWTDEQLYQMEWTDHIQTLIHILVDEEATVLSASGNSNHWHLRILFPDRNALSDTYDYCRENDLTLDIRNIYQLEQGRKGRFGLTDDQQDTLTLAFRTWLLRYSPGGVGRKPRRRPRSVTPSHLRATAARPSKPREKHADNRTETPTNRSSNAIIPRTRGSLSTARRRRSRDRFPPPR